MITFSNPAAIKLSRSHLNTKGWENASTQYSDTITPWFTYPALDFLGDILKPESNVFEYGAGLSSIFFNCNAKKVVSVEHDANWARKILALNSKCDIRVREINYKSNVDFKNIMKRYQEHKFNEPLRPSSRRSDHDILHGLLTSGFEGYVAELLTEPHKSFDIIVVDGMARQLCGFIAADVIADDGIIILDNSDRWQYNSLQRYLIEQGFGRIDFWGPGAVNTFTWCTSFFSKRFSLNNLHIERPVGTGDLGW